MSGRDVVNACIDAYLVLRPEGDQIELEALFPDEYPIPDDLIERVREHKPEILALLGWQEQADALLLDSTRRLAAAWPEGCPLDRPEWDRHEAALLDAYWSGDADTLVGVLRARETFALSLFDAYRNEVIR